MSGPDAIAGLIAGFKSFRAAYYEQRPDLIRHLIEEGQRPEIAVVACSDARVDPALLLHLELGELFVVRNVANLVPPYAPDSHYHGTSAALEYAVRNLGVGHVIVLGHSECGGIRALIDVDAGHAGEPRDFIAPWVSIAAAVRGGEYGAKAAEQAAIKVSLANLMTFPWIRDGVADGRLALHGWWFDLAGGALWGIGDPSDDFSFLG